MNRTLPIPSVGKEYPRGISVCIPAFNEESTIEQVVLGAIETLDQIAAQSEVLVIDDCSKDRTWEILCAMRATTRRLRLRRHEINRGIAATFAELYEWASNDLVFLNSADGQWKMNTLLELLPMAEDHDIIVARRRTKCYSLGRHVVSWLFNALPYLLFATQTYDAGSVKLVRRAIYDIPIVSRGVFAEAERIIRAQRLGLRVGVRDVEHFPRTSGKALGAKPSLVLEAIGDLWRCWFDIVILRRC